MKHISIISLAVLLSLNLFSQQNYKHSLLLMGSDFEITVVAENQASANQYINMAVDEIKRIEQLISSWDPDSQTSAINRNAGVRPIKVDIELYELIERANNISRITDGAFDISYASMDKLWKFDGSMDQIPSEKMIKKSAAKIGYKNIILNKSDTTVFLKLAGMKIGFGGIGKGFAADKAKMLLIDNGVSSGIINASGDMNCWGKQADGREWQVAVTNPLDKNRAFALLPILDGAVVTSGDYEKYVVIEGERYSHIINPKTAYPSKGLVSVTVFAPQAELADALATSVFVMNKEVGLDLINQLPQTECIIVDEEGNIYTSENIMIDNKK